MVWSLTAVKGVVFTLFIFILPTVLAAHRQINHHTKYYFFKEEIDFIDCLLSGIKTSGS